MNTDHIASQIEKCGLSDKEARVYTTLLELGGGFPSRIAEHCHLKRSTVYKVLLDLSVKGLINEIKKRNKLFYQPDKPEKLVRYAKSRITGAHDQLKYAEEMVPELKDIFQLAAHRPKVLFFEGSQTVAQICDDMISGTEKYEMLAFSNAELFKNNMTTQELKYFVKNKERIGITTRAIIPDTEEGRAYKNIVFAGIKKSIHPKIKYISKDQFPYAAEITIYGKNKVSITKLTKTNVIGIIIEDDTIHGIMKMVFEIAWSAIK